MGWPASSERPKPALVEFCTLSTVTQPFYLFSTSLMCTELNSHCSLPSPRLGAPFKALFSLSWAASHPSLRSSLIQNVQGRGVERAERVKSHQVWIISDLSPPWVLLFVTFKVLHSCRLPLLQGPWQPSFPAGAVIGFSCSLAEFTCLALHLPCMSHSQVTSFHVDLQCAL